MLQMLKTAYMDGVLEKTQVFVWFSHFKRGEKLIDSNHISQRSMACSDGNVDKIRQIVSEQ